MTPETQRELIRVANRDRLNSAEVLNLVDFSEGMLTFATGSTAEQLLDMWKQSFEQ